MAYQVGAQVNEEATSLTEDTARIVGRLEEIRQRLVKLHGALHGQRPESVKDRPPESPSLNLRRDIDRAHGALSDIETELSQLEKRL